ncbi:hypothetical protein MHU86_23168 [Fragilaria crotonensis]|nr:hypothetical protein MHU86_23168 [Fragilaria crotonensis]
MKSFLLAVPWLLTTVTANDVDYDHHHLRSANGVQHRMLAEIFVGNATANWEVGALSKQGSVPAAASGDVNVYNDDSNGRVLFRHGTVSVGRTNGAGDNGVASKAFKFKFNVFNGAQPWQNTVPIAFGKKNGRDTLWTPQFNSGSVALVHMGQFSTDGGQGDESSSPGVIQRGNFRAVDGDLGANFNCNRTGKVCFHKLVNNIWNQIGRTNGPGDDGNLISFTVLKVRTNYTTDAAGKILNVYQDVPIAQINGVSYNNYLGLQTPNYGNNIGTQTMLLLPKLT